MKFVIDVAGKEFPFEVVFEPQTFVACRIDLKRLPMDEVARLAWDADLLRIRTEDGKESTQIQVAGYRYPSASLFMVELEELLRPLPQVKVASIEETLRDTFEKHLRQNIEGWALPIAAEKIMNSKLNVHSLEDIRQKIVEYVPSAVDVLHRAVDDEELIKRWRNICWYLMLDEIHPGMNMKSILKKMDQFVFTFTSLGPQQFPHRYLAKMAAAGNLYVNWSPVPVVPEGSSFGFFTHAHQDYDMLQVGIKYDWFDDNIQVWGDIGGSATTAPVYVAYRLYEDGTFTVVLDEENEKELKMEPISTDVPVPFRTLLHVPILDVETLDMMLGLPTTFRQYALYDMFTDISLPVFVEWNSPVEAMFVLDRMATMLTSGMVIADYPKSKAEDDAHSVELRYMHPQILKSLVAQVLMGEYINASNGPLSLNRVAYAWLWLNRHFGNGPDCLREIPWQRVTVEGLHDFAAVMSTEQHGGVYNPPMRRSYPSFPEYVRERRALAGAMGFPAPSDGTVLMVP